MSISFDHILKLQELLNIEKQEDLKLYQQQFLSRSVIERKANGLTWYPLVINSSEFGYGDFLILELERTNDFNHSHQFQPGKNAELFSFDSSFSINGIVKSVEANKLTLALNVDDLPDWAYEGKLGLNVLFDEFSYQEMEINLNKLIKANNNRLAELREVLIGSKKAEFHKIVQPYENSLLNDSQIKGIEKMISAKDVAIIHGPPGTGKTTTLVAGIIEILNSEDQVLVCSPSNIAIDVICEKLIAQGIDVLRIGNPVRVSESLLNVTLDGKISSHPYYKEVKEARKRAEDFRKMAQKYKRNFGHAEREQRNLLFKEARQFLKEANQLEGFILGEQIGRSRVIASTLVGSSHRLLRDKQFTTVFIDEAAQALEPACWIPISRADRVIFAGDHCQLPPTVKSKVAMEKGLGVSLFEHCIKKENIHVMLKVQYRMNNEIMNFSNRKFYLNQLTANSSAAFRYLGLKDKIEYNLPFEFIDTAGCGYEESLNNQTLSISNTGELDILKKHLTNLLMAYTAEKEDSKLSIGIISPYKEQTVLLNKEIASDEYLQHFKQWISVKSIDGFQGQEKDIIYISMVRSNDKGEIGFLSDTRRMNVALTRARKKMIVIGDSATLSFNPFYKDFLDYVEEINAYKSAWEYV